MQTITSDFDGQEAYQMLPQQIHLLISQSGAPPLIPGPCYVVRRRRQVKGTPHRHRCGDRQGLGAPLPEILDLCTPSEDMSFKSPHWHSSYLSFYLFLASRGVRGIHTETGFAGQNKPNNVPVSGDLKPHGLEVSGRTCSGFAPVPLF